MKIKLDNINQLSKGDLVQLRVTSKPGVMWIPYLYPSLPTKALNLDIDKDSSFEDIISHLIKIGSINKYVFNDNIKVINKFLSIHTDEENIEMFISYCFNPNRHDGENEDRRPVLNKLTDFIKDRLDKENITNLDDLTNLFEEKLMFGSTSLDKYREELLKIENLMHLCMYYIKQINMLLEEETDELTVMNLEISRDNLVHVFRDLNSLK